MYSQRSHRQNIYDLYDREKHPPEKNYKTFVNALFEASDEIARSIVHEKDDRQILDFAIFRVEQLVRFGRELEKRGAKLDPEPGSLVSKWVAHIESLLEDGGYVSASAGAKQFA